MEEKMIDKILDTIASGVFAIILGAGWIVSSIYHFDTFVYVALGVGHTLIVLNLAWWTMSVKVSKFSLYIGLLVNASTVAFAVLAMPLVPTATVLAGLAIVSEAMQKTFGRKTL